MALEEWLYAYELSRKGWHVMPTVRNARGADLYAASDDESRVLPIQSKALSQRAPVPLGGSLDAQRLHWWGVTINANTLLPKYYIMTLDEVKGSAHRGVNATGKVSFWLHPKAYALPSYEEAWDRLEIPAAASLTNDERSPTPPHRPAMHWNIVVTAAFATCSRRSGKV